jgi:hypothetical protein
MAPASFSSECLLKRFLTLHKREIDKTEEGTNCVVAPFSNLSRNLVVVADVHEKLAQNACVILGYRNWYLQLATSGTEMCIFTMSNFSNTNE